MYCSIFNFSAGSFFVSQHLKGLKEEMLEEIPFISELLGDLDIQVLPHVHLCF